MATAGEQIAELERRIETLRRKAVLDLNARLAEAQNRVTELENRIAEITGSLEPSQIEPENPCPEPATDYRRSQPEPQKQFIEPQQPITNAFSRHIDKAQEVLAKTLPSAPGAIPVGKRRRVLSITRKLQGTVHIGDAISLRFTQNNGEQVRFAIVAPLEVPIFRGELYRQNQPHQTHPSDPELI